MIKKIKDIIYILRLKQWIKNLFILLPLIFSGQMASFDQTVLVLCAFLAFSYVTSAVYILNDYIDRDSDQLHPLKSRHPFVERKPHILWVLVLAAAFLSGGAYVATLLDMRIVYLALFYVLVQVIYNCVTKKIVLLDVFSIAIGFQIRIWIGAVVLGITPSGWLQLCVLLLALFLGFAKRRQEMTLLQSRARDFKHVFNYYRRYFLDQILIICGTLMVIFYGLYSLSVPARWGVDHQMMVYSNVFVIYGVFRYIYLIHQKNRGSSDPGEILFSDPSLFLAVLSWFGYIFWVIYIL